MEPPTPRLALWVLLLLLGVATVVGELVLFRLGLGAYALAAPVAAVIVGLGYLAIRAPARTSSTAAPEEEPFDDPVEEALRTPSAETPPAPITAGRAATGTSPPESAPPVSDDAESELE